MDTEELKNITNNAEKKRKNSDSGDEDEESTLKFINLFI